MMTVRQMMDEIPGVNKTTIYRNLARMVEEGSVKELRHEKDTVWFERADHNHSHVVCRRCGTVFPLEISQNRLAELFSSPLYDLEGSYLDLFVICANCKTRLQTTKESA